MLVTLLVAVLLTATGCVADKPGATDKPGTSGTDRAADAAGPDLTTAELHTLERAEQVLIGRCLRAQHFAYVEPGPEPEPGTRRFRYVVDDIAWARSHGYGLEQERRIAARKDADPNARYFRSLPPERRKAALAALNGARPVGLSVGMPGGGVASASDSGCTAGAQRNLYGDLRSWFSARLVVANLAPLYVPRVREDRRFRQAEAAWARCMAGLGHRLAGPHESRQALAALVRGLPPARARTAEIRLAVAEAECARDSGLAKTADALDEQYGAEVRHRYGAQIATRLRLQRSALPRAHRILAGADLPSA
ncbi:hypothetical protein DEJ50_31455 [Streptomyces venezuelae]|uniref:Lipoprotein n=1 Tax=Streptomyces venezuelae TaxID=54571 RepID=A0A5P2DFC4_STRVZ|nr:hypothetical protein DEJ50_31455 [Streptomyces venezuelae]